MRIKVRLSPSGVKQAEKELAQYRAAVKTRLERFVTELAKTGVEVARVRFSAAAYDGDNDVKVEMFPDGTRAKIVASGKSVLFIEFGTGTVNPLHSKPMFTHGTYGKGYGNSEKYPKGWVYSGAQGTNGLPVEGRPGVYRSKGNPPAEAMWGATEEMAKAIERVWREVMSK